MGIHDLRVLSLTTQTTIDQIPSSILKESMNYHFFLRWDDTQNSEFMFQLKKILKDTGRAYYPVSLKCLDKSYKLKVVGQLEVGRETRLYVTNWDCLHAWNIDKIYIKPKKDFFSKNKGSIHDCFRAMDSRRYAWLELNDMFILHANHVSGNQGLEREVGTLWSVDNFESLGQDQLDLLEPKVVIDSSGLSIFDNACEQDNKVVDSENKKWIECNRNLTSDYFLRARFLKDSIYQESWNNLQEPTKHYLVEHSRLKLESANLKIDKKLSSLNLCFDKYISAIMCELQHYYVKPVIEVIKGTPSIIDFLDSSSLKEFNILEKQSNFSFGEVFDFFLNAKAMIFSLRRKLERDLDNKSIMADRILQKHEKITEAFYRSGILQSLEELIKIQEWFEYHNCTNNSFSTEEMHQFVFKINVIISRLGSSSFDENLILKIYRETNGKTIGDKKLSLLIDELKVDHLHKKAA